MKKEIEIFSVNEALPTPLKKVLCLGEAAGASPNMGGAYWFISYLDDKPKGHLRNRCDSDGFLAAYVTHWCELPSTKV